MFTGIVEDRGTVTSVDGSDRGVRIEVATSLASSLAIGDSMAVNGVCLTAVTVTDGACGFDVVPETLDRSNLGTLSAGDGVNLERSMPADGRFDGHIVQGHVDGRGTVVRVVEGGDGVRVTVAVDPGLRQYLVEKGSVTMDGVSLTIASLTADGFEVALIPHTLTVTNLGRLSAGATVNLEVDVIAKYVERILESRL